MTSMINLLIANVTPTCQTTEIYLSSSYIPHITMMCSVMAIIPHKSHTTNTW